MAEQEEEQEQQLPSDDHVPLNEGAVGKKHVKLGKVPNLAWPQTNFMTL